MKKIISILLLICTLLPFAACGKEDNRLVLFPCGSRSIAAAEGATFTSSDDKIVTVNDSGLVLGVTPGEAEITVKSGKKTTVYPITVLDPADYIRLYDCSKIEIKNSDIMDKVEQTKHQLLVQNATWDITTDAAKYEDRLTINYEGKVDGKTFEGGSARNETLILGSGTFIEGFESGLLGLKTGDEAVLSLTFPENYAGDADLIGKKVEFTVKITKTERPTYPTFDNDFVKANTTYEHVNEFEEKEYENAKTTLVIAQLVEKSKVITDAPKALYDHYFDQYVLRLQTVLYYEYGQKVNNLKELLKLLDMTEKQLRASAESQLAQSVVQDCIFHGFAYQQKIYMSEEDFAKGTAVYVSENGYASVDDLIATSGLSLSDLREVVFIDFIAPKAAEMAKIIME